MLSHSHPLQDISSVLLSVGHFLRLSVRRAAIRSSARRLLTKGSPVSNKPITNRRLEANSCN